MDNKFLSMLGLCKRAGLLEAGDEPVDAATRARDARVLFVASDAAENTFRRIRHFADNGHCPWQRLPYSKEELGGAIGRTSIAILAITDIGFAAALVQRLAQADPQAYGETAEALTAKAKRISERKSEQLAHEKNRKRGECQKSAPPGKALPLPEAVPADSRPSETRRPEDHRGGWKPAQHSSARFSPAGPTASRRDHGRPPYAGPGAGRPPHAGPGAGKPTQAGPGAERPTQAGPRAGRPTTQAGPGAGRPTHAGPGAGRPPYAGPGAGRPPYAGPGAGRSTHAGPGAGRPTQAGPGAGRPTHAGPRAGRPTQAGPGTGRPPYAGPGAGRPTHAGPGAERPPYAGPGAGRPTHAGPGAGRPTQAGYPDRRAANPKGHGLPVKKGKGSFHRKET